MPKVGKKKFPYTKEGIKAAKKYSKKTGEPIIYANEYSKGGVPKYVSGGGVEYYESKSGAGTGGVPDLHQAAPYDFSGVGGKSSASPEEELLAQEEEPTSTVDSEGCPEGQKWDEETQQCVEDVAEEEEEEGEEEEAAEEPAAEEPGDDPTKVKIHDEDPNVIKSQQAKDTGVGVTMKAEDPTTIKSQQAKDTGAGVTMKSKVKDADFGIDKSKFSDVATSKPEIKLPKLAGDNKPGSFIKPSSSGGGGLKLNLKDKISSGGGGGGSNPLEAIKDKVEEKTAKRGAIVKRKSKKGKYHKGGRANPKKKGLAIIIAIGKPRVNRKSKKR